MILVSDLIQDMRAAVDADDTTYYRNNRDYFPAINKAVKSVLSLLDKVLSANRLSDDALREISKFMVKDVTDGSILIPIKDMQPVWAITLVSPNPAVDGSGNMTDFTKAAERVSLEEWGKSSGNPFASGNTIITGDLAAYGYTTYASATGTTIKIRPKVDVTKLLVGYLEVPKEANTESDTIALPQSIYSMVLEKALWFLSYKQGDQTTLAQMSNTEINSLANLLT